MGGQDSYDWNADDSENLCICVDCVDRFSCDEKGVKMKKILNTSMVYFVLAIAAGVFHREFTKFSGFTGKTVLGNVHTHLLVMGAFLFLIVALFCIQLPGLLDARIIMRR